MTDGDRRRGRWPLAVLARCCPLGIACSALFASYDVHILPFATLLVSACQAGRLMTAKLDCVPNTFHITWHVVLFFGRLIPIHTWKGF